MRVFVSVGLIYYIHFADNVAKGFTHGDTSSHAFQVSMLCLLSPLTNFTAPCVGP